MVRSERALPEDLKALKGASGVEGALLDELLSHRRRLIVSEGARAEEDLTSRAQLVSEDQRHREVRECSVGVVLRRAEFADVEQAHVIELGQQPGIELVDIAEKSLVGEAEPRIGDQEIDVVVILLRR